MKGIGGKMEQYVVFESHNQLFGLPVTIVRRVVETDKFISLPEVADYVLGVYEYEEQKDDELEDEEIEEQQTKEKNVEEKQETQIIQGVLTEFCFEDYYCILCAFKDKYIVILMNSNCVRGIVLNSVEEAFDGTLARKLRDLEFYD